MTEKTNTDLNNDGHNDANGEFVEGNQEATSALPIEEQITLAELELIAAVEAVLEAGAKFAAIPQTPVFYVGDGYRIRFAGHELLELSRG